MELQFFCPRWGSEDISWERFCEKVKQEGYNGIEYGIARTVSEKELDEVWNLAEKYGLSIIGQHYHTYEADFSKHFDLYNEWLERMSAYPVVKINSQTGKDFFSFEQNKKLIDASAVSGLNIVHETHRNKFAFAAHVAKEFLEKIPALKITLDISHWVCVAESFLEDQQEAVQLAIEKTEHIHARVGYPEGPQVPDPQIASWQSGLKIHLNWWDQVHQRKLNEKKILTITPEFGPFPYMVPLPADGKPICDQWATNVFMMNLFKKRYE